MQRSGQSIVKKELRILLCNRAPIETLPDFFAQLSGAGQRFRGIVQQTDDSTRQGLRISRINRHIFEAITEHPRQRSHATGQNRATAYTRIYQHHAEPDLVAGWRPTEGRYTQGRDPINGGSSLRQPPPAGVPPPSPTQPPCTR